MKLGRREFVEVIGTSAVSTVMSPFVFGISSLNATETLERNGWQLKVAPTGDIVSLQDGKLELINRKLGDNHPRLLFMGKKYYICNQPNASRREGSKLIFQYSFSDRFTSIRGEACQVSMEFVRGSYSDGVETGIHACPLVESQHQPRHVEA